MERSRPKQIRVGLDDRAQGRIASVVLDNPERLNAMNTALMDEFVGTMSRLAGD